jgi:hypothetical protein
MYSFYYLNLNFSKIFKINIKTHYLFNIKQQYYNTINYNWNNTNMFDTLIFSGCGLNFI